MYSYTTAPSGSQPSWRPYALPLRRPNTVSSPTSSTTREAIIYPDDDKAAFNVLAKRVVAGAVRLITSSWRTQNGVASDFTHAKEDQLRLPRQARNALLIVVREGLSAVLHMKPEESGSLQPSLATRLSDLIADTELPDMVMPYTHAEETGFLTMLHIQKHVSQYLESRGLARRAKAPKEVFSSAWLTHLYSKGLVLDRTEELDWSGKGQHVEYGPDEADQIPLTYEKTLGHSQTAIVDSVRCRRICLARKKIVCGRRLKKEDAIVEVEHFMRLNHLHIVRVVGTYTFKRDLAILLYPAAEWDLDKFIDELWDHSSGLPTHGRNLEQGMLALVTFFGCLSDAIAYIHSKNAKYMDIKPKNILVRRTKDNYRTYIADFGIARAYKSAADAETDSPTSFTRTYAAPEVVHQDTRGFSADVFSLGCVFMEMIALLSSCLTLDEAHDERQKLHDLRHSNPNPAFYANITEVTSWYNTIIAYRASSRGLGPLEWSQGQKVEDLRDCSPPTSFRICYWNLRIRGLLHLG